MPLHPEYAALLAIMQSELPDDERERRFAALSDRPYAAPDGVVIEDLVIDGPHGQIPLRSYTPAAQASVPARALRPSPAPVSVLWVHGGGFAGGELDMPESHVVAAELSARTGARVVAVDYRLAGPGVRYPIPLDDVVAAWDWLGTRSPTGGRRVLGGASAGAALALACVSRRPGTSDLLLLAYPFAHFPVPALDDATTDEMRTFPNEVRFPPSSIEWMVENYVGRLHALPELALPGGAGIGPGFPPTYVLTAQYDELRPSGELLVRQLRGADLLVEALEEPGVLHGHLNRSPGAPGVDTSLDWFAGAIQRLS